MRGLQHRQRLLDVQARLQEKLGIDSGRLAENEIEKELR
jgi:hypothetical protein